MIECIRYKPYASGPLVGFADIYVEKWGVEIAGCSVCAKDGRRWFNFPSKEFQNEEGESKYRPLVKFRDSKHRDKFNELALAAVDRFCAEGGPPDQQGVPF